jgi:hypothetical protein
MTTLLVGTFIFGGIHTLLWLPRALQIRRMKKSAGKISPPPPSSDESRNDRQP